MTKDSQVIYCCTSCRIRLICGRRVSFEVYHNIFFIKVIDRNKFECACSYSRCFNLDFFSN